MNEKKITTAILYFVVLVLIMSFLSACYNAIKPSGENISENQSAQWTKLGDPIETGNGGGMHRYIDSEAGVVCWVYIAHYKGGLSCLPTSETNLK